MDRRKRKCIFRFKKMWLQDESCKPFVRDAWDSQLSTNSPEHIKGKLQQLGQSLMAWEASHFGSITKQLDTERTRLAKIQAQPPTSINIVSAKELEKKITTLMQREETMWFQRSRVNWLRDGDKNTAFFHRVASGRKLRNSIDRIQDIDGYWKEEHNDIAGVFQRFYANLFNSTADLNPNGVLDAVNSGIPDELKTEIGAPFTEAEIVAALSQMHPSKAPGPDDNALLAFEIFHAMKSNKATRRGYFALKLDMSKAYDMVEWDFLHQVMLRVGLPSHIASLIMRCVSTVSYSVLTNEIPGDAFIPTRGLRQGNPLSPYLFLFCAEVFSSLIRKSKSLGNIHGIQLCRRAPSVSHLFFADDSIIFGRANIQEIPEMKRIIATYGAASGQVVNFDKSEISFSGGVSDTNAQTLAAVLGVHRVDKHHIYLGILASAGRSKKVLFQSLVDRIRKKLKNWKASTLSVAGKLTLIKSVAQAIPMYIMSCFQIPADTCHQIDKLIANFWWGQEGDERKIHWLQWKKMCKPKENGGLGFREISAFNKAMLAKQGWRLLQEDGSLLARTLKARYYPNGDLLTASIGHNPTAPAAAKKKAAPAC
ncbi:hypothetical protein DH2020_034612 [Rehmannia glutinosa]|uniref:Reverse transcriptase domain-containing protein n=1 Tax=Rehmannia glutinosa TaxID=99300 RepID=A0ABR0VAI6_REHGL